MNMSRYCMRLHDRSFIGAISPENVVESTDQNDDTSHQDGPIHSLGSNRQLRRPEAEEQYKKRKAAREHIVHESKNRRKSPGTPCQLLAQSVGYDISILELADFASNASPE